MRLSPEAIAERFLDLERWPSFRGYGPLPGIKSASFRQRTEAVVGSQVAVSNLDGSTHVEEITDWRPGVFFSVRMSEFSPPVRYFATHFIESWSFGARAGGGSDVERAFELHPRHWVGSLVLLLIAPLLRRAVERHLAEMDAGD